jgi:catechol 2,3-dioxygenase-like lactoylglutathione lyase family enzyme
MFDHVTIRVADRAASRRFYETLLGPPTHVTEDFDEWQDFSLAATDAGHAATRNLHVAFGALSREEVDARWRSAVEAGFTSDGEPGPRPQYSPSYYGGFLLDPDGGSAEVVHGVHPAGGENLIDHLWLGVADLDASRRFYETVAPVLGFRVVDASRPGLVSVTNGERHFILVADGRPPTENLHLAFPVVDDESVAEFHRLATAAGYRDNGGPGERRQYHAGYVGAFVLDPDGWNVEAVHHNR